MFDKLHLLSQDVPDGGAGLRWRAHPYLRMVGELPKGPVVFEWSARQRADLEALWRDPAGDGARERLAKDLAAFADKLGWAADPDVLAEAERRGEELMLTISAVPAELYVLPWEVVHVGATGTYLSDYRTAQVRYSMPGLEPRETRGAPPLPGVLFAWSGAGGAVPHAEHAEALRAAAEAGGVAFRELAEVDEISLQAALDAGPPSVLHLLCHGLPGVAGEPSRLTWGASDMPSEIAAPRLARMLRRHSAAIRLVVLSTCGGGDGHGDSMLLGSLAQELHLKGIPSVVASRYPLSVRGSQVMTRALYDKLLREAWSLERALRHTREALLRVADDGESHPGDGYGIQLYAHDTEWFVSDNEIEAERAVLASYPFGTPARPVPARPPPATELTLSIEAEPGLSGDQLADRLRRVSEDGSLAAAIQSCASDGGCVVKLRTTVDGAQRLLGAWRSKALQLAIGAVVGELIVREVVVPAVKGVLSAAARKAGASGGKTAARAKSATAAGKGGAAVAQAGTAGQGGAAVAQAGTAGQAGAAVGQTAAVSVAKTAATAAAITGKAITTKVAIVALIGSVAATGGAAAYQTLTHAATQVPVATASASPGVQLAPPPTGALGSPASAEPALDPPRPTESPRLRAPAPRPPEPPSRPSEPQPRSVAPPPSKPPALPETVAPSPPQTATTAMPPTTAAVAQPAPGSAAPAPSSAATTTSTTATPPATAAVAQPIAAPEPTAAAAPQATTIAAAPQVVDQGASSDRTAASAGANDIVARSPRTIEPSALRAQLISGDSNIATSKRTRDAMIRDRVTSLRAVVKLCVDATGLVSDWKLTERTGYTEYDSRIIETIREWHYRPYLINGIPTPVCSTVEFIYSPQ